MLALGHPGITLGAATLIAGLLYRVGPKRSGPATGVPPGNPANLSLPSGVTSWYARLSKAGDIRLLLLGSLLPDIIDKPVGQALFRESIGNGRIYGHTLLFLIALGLAGLFRLRRRGKNELLMLASGVLAHLLLDEMWSIPQTLLWPLLGLEFPRAELASWMGRLWYALTHDPAVYIPEIVGGMVLMMFLWVLLHNGSFTSFVRRGQVAPAQKTPTSA